MDPAAVPHDGSAEARAVVGALATTPQCVACLARLARLAELAVRAVLTTTLKASVMDTVAPCVTCGARRLVYHVGTAPISTSQSNRRQSGTRGWPSTTR
jgi:hypothetical protein